MCRDITFCLLCAYIFIGISSGRGLAMLLMLADGIHYGNTHVSSVLTESILCLDHLRRQLEQFFSGSTLLLQVITNKPTIVRGSKEPERALFEPRPGFQTCLAFPCSFFYFFVFLVQLQTQEPRQVFWASIDFFPLFCRSSCWSNQDRLLFLGMPTPILQRISTNERDFLQTSQQWIGLSF